MRKKALLVVVSIILCLICVFGACFFVFKLKNPIMYREEINYYSKQNNFDEALIFGVINVESSFNKNAKSKAGALGLMQLLPSTANYVCELLNEPKLNNFEELFIPSTNIKLGCFYLNYLLKKFNGDLKLALLAYNAGEGKVREWINLGDVDKYAYEESLNYYKKVIKKHKIYSKML